MAGGGQIKKICSEAVEAAQNASMEKREQESAKDERRLIRII